MRLRYCNLIGKVIVVLLLWYVVTYGIPKISGKNLYFIF